MEELEKEIEELKAEKERLIKEHEAEIEYIFKRIKEMINERV